MKIRSRYPRNVERTARKDSALRETGNSRKKKKKGKPDRRLKGVTAVGKNPSEIRVEKDQEEGHEDAARRER